MKYFTISRSVVTVVFLSIVVGIFVFLGTQSQQANNKVENFSKNKASSTNEQNQIPDSIAYELFVRTIAQANASDLVKRAGLSDGEVERVMSEAYSLDEILQTTDKKAREIKENLNKLSQSKMQTELSSLQTFKENALARTINRFLPSSLNEAAMNKLQTFIYTEVKSNIQVVSVESISTRKDNTSSDNLQIKSSSKKLGRGNIYLYNASWQNTTNVYGSGVISETYPSGTNYRTTITITSTSGRSITTQSNWNNIIKSQSESSNRRRRWTI